MKMVKKIDLGGGR